jgi:site-specific DNA-cytosine methylase
LVSAQRSKGRSEVKIKVLAITAAVVATLLVSGAAMPPAEAFAKSHTKTRAVATKVAVKKATTTSKRAKRLKTVLAYNTPAAPATDLATAPVTGPQAEAQAIVNSLIARNPYLQQGPVTVTFGDARGYQAITYYTIGQIIVSPTHTASLDTILRHECGHIIDWRDNGRIDWGENIPVNTLYN